MLTAILSARPSDLMNGNRSLPGNVPCDPTPEGLWELRSRLLEAEVPAQDPIWKIVGEFRQLLDRLLSPALSGETDGTTKAVLLGLLFQVLVLHHLSPYLASAA